MKIRTRLLAIGGAVAMVGAMASFAAPAGASHARPTATPPTNVSGDSLTCDSMVGTIKFVPALVSGGDSNDTVSISEVASGCTDNTNGAVEILNGTFKGSLTTTGSNDCSGLLGLSNSTTGTINGKWKTITGGPKITPTSTDFTITQTNGVTYGPVAWGATYGEFQIGTVHGTTQPHILGLNNAFAGGDNGHSSTIDTTTGQDTLGLGIACVTTGIKAINFGIGGSTLA